MASVQWKIAASGQWIDGTNWDSGSPPSVLDDASIAIAGTYTVSLGSPIDIASLTIGDTGATMEVNDAGAVAVTGAVTVDGALRVDDFFGGGGSALTIGGMLSDDGTVAIGSNSLGSASSVTVGGLALAGELDITGAGTNQASLIVGTAAASSITTSVSLGGNALLQYASGQVSMIASTGSLHLTGNARVADAVQAATNSALTGLAAVAGFLEVNAGDVLAVSGDLSDTGQITVDDFFGGGGSTLTVGGTLTDSGGLSIGSNSLTSASTVTVGDFVDTGALTITGNGANQASLIVGTAAPGSLATSITLSGDSLLQYAGGQITTIAGAGSLSLAGNARVADAGAAASNSALTGLSALAGALTLNAGASVHITGDLSDGGTLAVDNVFGSGGSTLTVDGTLTDNNSLSIGSNSLVSASTVTLGDFVDTGALSIGGTGTNQASLIIGTAAPGSLATTITLSGDSLLQYASEQLTTIATAGSLHLSGNARVADAGAASTNSALTGLANVAGFLEVNAGAVVKVTGNLADPGQISLDDFFGGGGSMLTVGGTLTDSGGLSIGSNSLSSASSATVGDFVDTGALNIGGNGTNQASLIVGTAAPGTLTTNFTLSGDSLLQYSAGQITTIASTGSLHLAGNARVADTGATSTNSALTGLATVAGFLEMNAGAVVGVTGDLSDPGQINIDDFFGGGDSTLTIGGTLTDSGSLNIGSNSLASASTVTVGDFVDTGALTIAGAGTSQASLIVGTATPGTLATNFTLSGDSLLQYSAGQLTTIASAGALHLAGNARVADAGQATTNSALTGLATVAGFLELNGGAVVDVTGNLADPGQISVDDFFGGGGSTLTVGGTLTDSGGLNIGSNSLGSASTVTVGDFVDTGALTIAGTGANQASLIVGTAAPGSLATVISLSGNALLQYASDQITTITATGALNLIGNARVADAGATATNSALTGLANVAGTLALNSGAVLGVTGNLADTGQITVDDFFGGGGSALTVGGVLTDRGGLTIGSNSLGSATSVAIGGLVNTGVVTLTGTTASATATLTVNGAASNAGTVTINGGAVLLASGTLTQTAGILTDFGALSAATLSLSGGTLDGTGSITGAIANSGATLFGGTSASSLGTLTVTGSYTQSATGTLQADITGVGQSSLLAASGAVSLQGGTLDVQTGNGFTFAAGQSFTVLTAAPGALAGAFAAIDYNGASGNGSVGIGGGLFLQAAYNDAAGIVSLNVVQNPLPAPVITAPASQDFFAGMPALIPGISVTAQTPGAITVELLDQSGALSTDAVDSVTVSGGGGDLKLTGAADAVSQELGTLQYAPGTAAVDTLSIVATDSSGQTTVDQVALGIEQPPVITVPATLHVPAAGQAESVSDVAVSDASLTAAGGTLTVTLADTTGALGVTASGAATVTGSGGTDVTLSGSVADVNATLASLTFTGSAPDTVTVAASDGHPGGAATASFALDSFAVPQFKLVSGHGTLTQTAAGATLDLGTLQRGSGPDTVGIAVANTASPPADLLAGNLAASGDPAFSTAGLAAFSGLAGGQSDGAPTITLDTAAVGSFSETITLQSTGSNSSGYSAALPAQTLTITGLVAALPSPSVTVKSANVTAYTGMPIVLGLGVTDPNAGASPVTVLVTDTTGTLSAANAGQGSVGGRGTNQLMLTGSLADVNAELASLTYATAATSGADTVQVSVTDAEQASASQSVAIAVQPIPFTSAVINAPKQILTVPDKESAYGGISVSDPFAETTGQVITAEFTTPVGTLSVTGDYGGSVTGQNTNDLFITGTVAQINAYLGDSLLGLYIGTLGNFEGGIFSISGTVTSSSGEDLVANAGGPEGKFFQVGVAAASFALNTVTAAIPGNGPPPSLAEFEQTLARIITGYGDDTHFLGSDGIIYTMDAVGDFILATATAPSDSFDVQIRTAAVAGSASAAHIVEVAAGVGSDRVTIDVTRANKVWVDGAAVSLTAGTPFNLDGGELTQISDKVYQISWNTGEVLTVTDEGTYLNTAVAPGANDGSGSINGLLSLTTSTGNELMQPNGTPIPLPITQAGLNGAFADAWRVPQQFSLLDYGTGQTTATFNDPGFPAVTISLSDLPAAVVAQAAAAVAAAGITDPGIAAAAELDYITSGGDPNVVTADAAATNGLQTDPIPITPAAATPALGVLAAQAKIVGTSTAATPVSFTVYLTASETQDTLVDYAVVAVAAGDLGAAAFGGTLPTGQVTIAAGQTSATFTVDIPAGGLGDQPSNGLTVQISAPGGPPVFAQSTHATIVQAIPGAPPIPTIVSLTNIGTFTRDSATGYTLNLGDVQYGAPLPDLQFGIDNNAAAPSDSLGGTFNFNQVVGYTVNGDGLPSVLDAGQSYNGLDVTVNSIKFGQNTETITFSPTDTNITGFSANLAPITLTVVDNIVPPTMVFSQAYADVHIITYNGLRYDFQAVGEFTLAKSRVAGDSFDIQLRLQPYAPNTAVTIITQAAVSVGADRVTFDLTRPNTVFVDGVASTISLAQPDVALDGGKLEQLSSNTWQVMWNTGEQATVTNAGTWLDVYDGIPLAEPNMVAGLQGEDAGQANDFQLSDGTVLAQPLAASVLYGAYADSWRVSQTSSLLDYGPGQTTATFTDRSAPQTPVTLADFPTDVVAQAAAAVAAAGIVDPGTAAAAELDFAATGNAGFITSAQHVQQLVTATTPANITQDQAVVPAVGVAAVPDTVMEAATGVTAVTFDAYLTTPVSIDTVITYTVISPDASDLGAAAFGGTLPTGQVTIAAGQKMTPFTIDLPQGALGTAATAGLVVQVSGPAGSTDFVPQALATVINAAPEPGVAPVPQIAKLSMGATLTENSATSYTIDLGALSLGQNVAPVQLAVENAAAAGADAMGGAFSPPVGNGFLVTGNSLSNPVAAGQSYTGLYLSPQTTQLGPFSETFTFTPTDTNASGFSANLAPITITVNETVGAAAQAVLNTPTTVLLPNARVGSVDSQAISITNAAAAPALPLDVAATATRSASVTGSISDLAAGATDTTSMTAGLNTATAGAQSGTVILAPASDIGGGQTTALPGAPVIGVFGSIFRAAAPTAIAPVSKIIHVGDGGSFLLPVSNTVATDGFSENLDAALSVTGSIAAGTATATVAPGASSGLSVSVDTAAAGVFTGVANVALASDGGTGAGSLDGLGTLALPSQAVAVSVTVDNLARAVIEQLAGGGVLTVGPDGAVLDFGDVALNSAAITAGLAVLNGATGPADLLSGSFTGAGSGVVGVTGLDAFSGLGAGAVDSAPTVTVTPDQVGEFSTVITLDPTGSNASGFSGALGVQTLTIKGNVTETPVNSVAIAGTQAGQMTTDLASIDPFAAATVTDTDAAASITLTVTPSSTVNGALSDPDAASDGGVVNVDTGAYSVTGSIAAVDAALQGLVFTPTAHEVPAGQTVTTGFTIAAADGTASTMDNATTVIATAVATPGAPTLLLSDGATKDITNSALPTVDGVAADNALVTLFNDGQQVGQTTADATTGAYSTALTVPLGLGNQAIMAVATGPGGASLNSAPVDLFEIPAPIAGVSTTDNSSLQFDDLFQQGYGLQFIAGTQEALLVDGQLSVGQDTDEASVQRLYEGLLGRANDPSGIEYWTDKLLAGDSKTDIAQGFLTSTEYAAEHGAMTDTQFVQSLYTGLLGRPAEQGGLSFWTGLLTNGQSRADVTVGIADSNEAKTHLAPDTSLVWAANSLGAEVYQTYETGLGRIPELNQGLSYWKGILATTSPETFANAFTQEPEFVTLHAGQSDSAFVTSLYQDGLGRAPDAPGLQFWDGQLSGGTATRPEVLLGISQSAEASAHLTRVL